MFDAANYVSRVLRENQPSKYTTWLNDAVGRLEVKFPNLINAIGSLDCPILTLNYDNLIEKTLNLTRTLWTQGDIAQAIIRQDFKRVLHVHGHYDTVDTVILSEADYARVRADAAIQSILESIIVNKTLLFIGCGGTLDDPNWKSLLIRLEQAFAKGGSGSMYSHYLLVLNSEKSKYLNISKSVITIGYGKEYDDLPRFIEWLSGHNPNSKKN